MGPATWDYWGPAVEEYGYYWETYVYLGMVPLLLAGAGLTLVRGRLTLFLGLLTSFCLIGILGETTPFPRLLHGLAPGFGMFRAHSRLGLVMGFAVAVLAGVGLDAPRAACVVQQLRGRFVVHGHGVLLLERTFEHLAREPGLRIKGVPPFHGRRATDGEGHLHAVVGGRFREPLEETGAP